MANGRRIFQRLRLICRNKKKKRQRLSYLRPNRPREELKAAQSESCRSKT